nr:mat1b [Madagascaria erythrocladioides]
MFLDSIQEVDWGLLPWKKIEKFIFFLQEKIYIASINEDQQKLHKLQSVLSNSSAAKLFAVKQVTENRQYSNQLKISNKNILNSSQKIVIASNLDWNFVDSSPIFNEEETTSLIKQQSLEIILFWCLQPEWEGKSKLSSNKRLFNNNIKYIVNTLCTTLSSKKFDNNLYNLIVYLKKEKSELSKRYILNSLNTITQFHNIIGKCCNEEQFSFCLFKQRNIPLGIVEVGNLNQLFAYILLFDLEKHMFSGQLKQLNNDLEIIRYQENILLISSSIEKLREVFRKLKIFLKKTGLNYDFNKTRLLTRQQTFCFVGFEITPKFLLVNKSFINQVAITAAKEERKLVLSRIRYILRSRHNDGTTRAKTNMPLTKAISLINPIVINWRKYFIGIIPSSTLDIMDRLLNEKIYRWYVKRLKKNRVTHWNTKCILILKNKKRIAQNSYILELFNEPNRQLSS